MYTTCSRTRKLLLMSCRSGRIGRSSRKVHHNAQDFKLFHIHQTRFPLLVAGVMGCCCIAAQLEDGNRCDITLCEQDALTRTTASAEDSPDTEMINTYVKSLMKDHELIKLPMGMGKTAPFLMDVTEFHKTLVLEAITSFEVTVDAWNQPGVQGKLAGHPIVYEQYRCNAITTRELVHNPKFVIPFEAMEVVTDILMEEPRIVDSAAFMPRSLKRFLLMNILHVLTSILMDLMLSSSVSVHQGSFEMQWTFQPEKANAYYQGLVTEKESLKVRLKEALQQMDFDVVEEAATLAVKGQQHSLFFSYFGKDLYATAYKVMLIVFYIFNWDTECRFMGRGVRQKCVKPNDCND